MTDVTWRDNGRVVIRDAGAAELPVLQDIDVATGASRDRPGPVAAGEHAPRYRRL